MMNKNQTAKACLALGSSNRITIFLMVKIKNEGMLLHDIADKLQISYVMTLFHVNKLTNAKLMRKKKTKEGVLVAANKQMIEELFTTMKGYAQ